MTRTRTTHIVILAVAACIAVGSTVGVAKGAGTPPPPPPPGGGQTTGGGGGTTTGGGGGTTTTGGGGGGTTTTGGGGTGTPVSHPTPPMAAAVGTAATAPRVITVSWKLPKSAVITGVVVRRGSAANCPATTAGGVGIGTTAKRSNQVDRGVRAGATYCYSVFTTSPYRVSAAAHHTAVVGPPGKVTGVVAKPVGGGIQISWLPAAGATHYILKRQAGSCPTASKGRAIHRRTGKTRALDTLAQPGTGYCYAVFAANGTKFASEPTAARNHNVSIPVAAAPSTGSSSSLLTSSLVKVVGGIALGVLLLAAVAFLAAKLIARAREDDWQYSQSSHRGGARLALGRYEGPALVIPAAIVVVSLVLLIAAALSL